MNARIRMLQEMLRDKANCGGMDLILGFFFGRAVNNQANLALLHQQASVFVYPSVAEKGESFGLAPLEAMAYGVVPIVSDLACFKDFIQDQVNGLVFDHRNGKGPAALASALSHLLKEEPIRQLLSQRATQVRESHALNRIADTLLKDFEALL